MLTTPKWKREEKNENKEKHTTLKIYWTFEKPNEELKIYGESFSFYRYCSLVWFTISFLVSLSRFPSLTLTRSCSHAHTECVIAGI